jgi:hypothetical protein
MAAAVEPVSTPKMNCAIPRIPISGLSTHVQLIIDNLQAMNSLSIPDELSINIVSIIVGSCVSKVDFDNPSPQYPYPRNHECPAFVSNLLQNPGCQISPALIEYIRQQKIHTININQYMFLIYPMYSREEYTIPYGLASIFPSVMHNPINAKNGFIIQDELLPAPIKYNSLLEPYIIPQDINEREVNNIIEQFQTVGCGSLLINLMDCTSNTLRRLWMQNTAPNVYLAMPDCLTRDNTPMYMPVITYSSTGCRWINWSLDKELAPLYQLISPHTYEFLIHNYKRLVLETYFMPICKILGRMRVTLEYKLDDTKSIIFSLMSFQEFKNLWNHHRVKFASLFISFMDEYYKWNYYKFIEILLEEHSDSEEPSMQKILLGYLKKHLQQLRAFFPSDHIPEHIIDDDSDDDKRIQSFINDYLHENDIH